LPLYVSSFLIITDVPSLAKRREGEGMLEMKWIALLVLIVQNSSQVIIMRYSRLSPGDDGKAYLASTAVLCSEVIKLFGSY
jgi:hypothetical protein